MEGVRVKSGVQAKAYIMVTICEDRMLQMMFNDLVTLVLAKNECETTNEVEVVFEYVEECLGQIRDSDLVDPSDRDNCRVFHTVLYNRVQKTRS